MSPLEAVIMRLLVLLGVIFAAAAPLSAQPSSAASVCLDRCDAGFKQCLQPEPPTGPNTPIPPEGAGRPAGVVRTGQPFEECLLNYQICTAQCSIELAQERRKRVR